VLNGGLYSSESLDSDALSNAALARELPRVSLEDALQLVHIYAYG
jgi:hypothetical protein